MNGIFAMRYVLIGLGGVLGIALLASGNVLIGGLVLAMSAMRLVMVVKLHERRRTFEQRREQRREQFRQRRAQRFSR